MIICKNSPPQIKKKEKKKKPETKERNKTNMNWKRLFFFY